MRDIKEDTKYFQSFDQEWSVGHKSMGIPKSPALVDRQNLTTIAKRKMEQEVNRNQFSKR